MDTRTPDDALPGDRTILDRTGRTFALSLRALPRGMREPAEVGYLLARAADTVADRASAPAAERAAALGAVLDALERGAVPEVAAFAPADADGNAVARAESALLARLERLVARYRALPDGDRADVRTVVVTLVSTMRGELEFFGDGDAVRAWPDGAALVRYTEGIAGCVGPFWTALAARHVAGVPHARRAWFERAGRRYGRGLQLVNVLRDVPRDLLRGRCFLPEDELRAAGVAPAALRATVSAAVSAAQGEELRRALAPVFARWEARARRGLYAGLLYGAALPRAPRMLRAASVLPARLGLLTIARLAHDPARLDPREAVRVPRSAVRASLGLSLFWSLFARGPLRLARGVR